MLLLAHTGITLGAALVIDRALSRNSWFDSLRERLDLRLLLIGSLLPDIIDKPTAFLFRSIFSYGRTVAHTLLFLLIITLAGVYLCRRGKLWLIILSSGTFMHLILDQMWLWPEVLLWPLYGFAFPSIDPVDSMLKMFGHLFTVPGVYLPEILGLLILGYFGVVLNLGRGWRSFLYSGRVPASLQGRPET